VFIIINETVAILAASATMRPNTRMQSDRFAREIGAILAHSGAARSRRLMRNSMDANGNSSLIQKAIYSQ